MSSNELRPSYMCLRCVEVTIRPNVGFALARFSPSSFWQNSVHTENNTQCFSRKNANTNDEPEIIVHVASHLQMSQIPKIKSKKGTGTWNPSRMTKFQGQSAKRDSNKKNFKSGQNQPNAILCFITFRNHRQNILMLFHIYKCRRFRKSNQKRAPELVIPAE